MKKYFLKFIVMAVLGTACIFVSCNKDDGDDPALAEIPVFMVTLNGTSVDLAINHDEQIQLVATVSPSGTKERSVEWSTSDESVVSVNNGLLKGLKIGSATITAKSTADPSKTATCNVTVRQKTFILNGFKFEFRSDELVDGALSMNIGDTRNLGLNLKLDPDYTTNETITWSSSNPDVVSVDEKTGEITVKGAGGARIDVRGKETIYYMGEDMEVDYYDFVNIVIKGLVYEYTEADFEKCAITGTPVLGRYAYWLNGEQEIYMTEIEGLDKKALNTNLRTDWDACEIRIQFAEELSIRTINNCNRFEVDFLFPQGLVNDPATDHMLQTRFRVQGDQELRDTNINPDITGPYILEHGELINEDYYLVTMSIKPKEFKPSFLEFDNSKPDFVFHFYTWYLGCPENTSVLLSGLRFYVD